MHVRPRIIQTARLDLVLLNRKALQASLAENATSLKRMLGAAVPLEWFDANELIELRHQQLIREPGYEPWSVRAMIERQEGAMIGHIGFHTQPGAPYLNSFAPDGVEFGFTVYPKFRRKGYAREASLGLMAWAYRQHSVSEFVLTISPENIPSLNLAAQLGFKKIGTHVDKVDGIEDIFRLYYHGVV